MAAAFSDLAFGEAVEFALEFVVTVESGGIELVVVKCVVDGAAGFVFVLAVVEAAVLGEGVDVIEDAVDGFGAAGELEFAHAGGVDEDAAVVW